ncbi:MAG: L-rhamnose mutarotase [Propionibacteriaceae bacterium]|nr:L-rhamnose mutarotase [Microlunatus antarcticus]RYZ31603.1 MAG: L-rhamnose mutarotase [Propionibacteriaceae bacterium]
MRGQVRPDQVAEYRRVHTEVWPEMLAALRDAGWHDYSLYVGDDGVLVGFVSTDAGDDLDAIQRRVQGPVNDRWQRSVAALFASEGAPDQAWQVLPEVFHLD